MANTFLLADGISIGASLAEPDMVETARRIKDVAKAHDCTLILPVDVVVASEFKLGATHACVNVNDVGPQDMILDAGPLSIAAAIAYLDR